MDGLFCKYEFEVEYRPRAVNSAADKFSQDAPTCSASSSVIEKVDLVANIGSVAVVEGRSLKPHVIEVARHSHEFKI